MAIYGTTSLDTSPPPGPYPLSSAIPDGTNTPIPIEGGPTVANSGNPIAPVAIWVKDGNDVTQGLSTDANTVASVMGRLTKIRDLLAGTLSASITNATALGQALMSASSPVVLSSDHSPIKVQSAFVEQASLSAGALNADLVPATDVSAYKWLSLQVEGTFTGTLTFQWSNDNVNYRPLFLNRIDAATGGSGGSATAASGQGWAGPITFRWLRVRMTAYTSGTATGTLELYTQAPGFLLNAILSSQSGTWTVGLQSADITAVAAAAYTTTQTQADQTNTAAKGIRVVLNVTSIGTGSITLEIDAKDVASGVYTSLLTGVAVVANSTVVYVIHPELTAAANSIAKDILPRTWRIKVVANNANSVTYSVGASYLI